MVDEAKAGKVAGRADILGKADRPHEDVYVPEWETTVRIRAIGGTARDAFEAAVVRRNGKNVELNMVGLRARLVAASAVDEAGKLLFSEEDIPALGEKSAAALDRLFVVAQRLAGLTDADARGLAEGFRPAPSGGSTSA